MLKYLSLPYILTCSSECKKSPEVQTAHPEPFDPLCSSSAQNTLLVMPC